MRLATLSAPKYRSPVTDWTGVGSPVLRERRCKGTRRARFEMVGIASARIACDRTIQRHRAEVILKRNEEGLSALAIQHGLCT